MTDRIDDWIKEHLGGSREVPADLVQKAKDLVPGGRPSAVCPHCGGRITPFKKPPSRSRWNLLWLGAAALSFALSYAFPHYFMQFLAVSLVSAFKWLVEHRAMKTQILIYKALAEDEGSEGSRLHRHASHL